MTMKLSAVAAAFALSVVTGASGASATWKVFASKSASGDFAIALAGGKANHPQRLAVRVRTKPAQRVSVSWTMVCSKGLGAGSKSGQFKAAAPLLRALKMPMRHPDDCIVSASAQLDRSGSVRVALLTWR
jgi:hypothetical protein